jgi:release factor glutamine methyltransferase
MTAAEARRALADAFRAAGLDSPELDARLLVCHALGIDHTGLATAPDRLLTTDQQRTLDTLKQRRLARESVAHILGAQEFWGLTFRISGATLVPRADTETVVEAALAAIDESGPRKRPLRIADLGTGSGALLLALLSELPNALGVGTDISMDALRIAAGNAASLGLDQRSRFVCCHFGAALAGGFDLVVSNPPYIPTADIVGLSPEVRREPMSALDGGADGLSHYRAIAADAPRLVAPGGGLVLELGIGQEEAVAELVKVGGLRPRAAKRDLAGIPRALRAHRPPSP